jgi:hypothetical protein
LHGVDATKASPLLGTCRISNTPPISSWLRPFEVVCPFYAQYCLRVPTHPRVSGHRWTGSDRMIYPILPFALVPPIQAWFEHHTACIIPHHPCIPAARHPMLMNIILCARSIAYQVDTWYLDGAFATTLPLSSLLTY